ncbi:hypothetical protein [Hymenobacter norwichensis]|uniref:hypothetical protein n=1 Tax=Hymenobacter norwichensis TaxID=223903 RepID=UPI0003B5C651|nr:hypothetical protein [Hymenobacter norwichensis]
MHRYPYGLALALLAGAPSVALAQTPSPTTPLPPLTYSPDALKEGVELYDKQQYEAAVARYRAVTPGDSLYPAVQSELATTYLALEKYREALEAANRALALHYLDPQPYVAAAWAEEELKHLDKAQAFYDAGLKRYPYHQTLWFNQGVMQVEAKRFEDGFRSLQRGVSLKPTHPNSHYQLASLAMRQGQTSRAMLGLLAYLLVNPDGSNSHDMLVTLEQLATHTAVVEENRKITPFLPNEAFKELDLLIDSKVALRPEYVSKVKFNAALVKQTQLLVEKFPAAATDDYWVRLYGPLVEQLRQGDNLTTFTYLVLASADDKKAAQWVKGNKSKVEKLYTVLTPALLRIREQQPVERDGKTVLAKAWFDDEARVDGLGEGTVQGEERRFTGPWLFVNQAGSVEEEGNYGPDFKRTGTWRHYHPNGQLQRTVSYRNGEMEGLVRDYHDNGQLASEMPMTQGKVNGLMKVFTYCGELSETRTFRAGELEGPYQELYPGGKLKMKTDLRADKQEGVQTYFYSDGSKEYEYTYVAGKKQGPFLVNFADNVPEKRGTYDQGELHGPYTDYFSNGQLENTGTFTHGKRTGLWKEYFADGKLSAEVPHDEAGELHGTYHDYNYQGKLFSDLDYEHGRLTRLRYYDPTTSKLVQDTPIKKGRVPVQLRGADGITTGTGTYLDGQMEGEWRWQYTNGVLQQMRSYKQGQQEGSAVEYYANGQLKKRTNYRNGSLEGTFESFLRDGQRSQTGYYRAGQQQGPWRDYYADGQVSEEYEMHQGQKNGVTRSFAPNGKLTESRVYAFGRKLELTTYDTLGGVLSHIVQQPATKEFIFVYPNGKVHYRTPVACYENRGPATWYHLSGQPEVVLNYEADRRHGPYKSYFQNGQLHYSGEFRNGERHGLWQEYYSSGQLRSTINYRYGNWVGETRYYFPNGKLEAVQNYLYGTPEGVSQYYNPAGELLEERLYEHGNLAAFRPGHDQLGPWQRIEKLTGTMKTSFANGKPATDETVRGGMVDGTRTTYYSSGQVFRRMSFKEGLLTGTLTGYHPSGKLMEEEQYLHGELHGRCRYYRPDGTLEREESYRSGEKLGPTVYYDTKGKPTKTEIYWNQYVYEGK